METVKRVGLDTNIFMGIFLEEKEKLGPSLKILGLICDGALEEAGRLPENFRKGRT